LPYQDATFSFTRQANIRFLCTCKVNPWPKKKAAGSETKGGGFRKAAIAEGIEAAFPTFLFPHSP